MTHNEYIANIQYKIDRLFYEYDNIELYKYQNYEYYNEYTNFNHYDTLMLEAEEKKGIIRRIIDGIMKVIRTIVDKVKSFFSKNKNIDKNAEVKVNKNLLDRVNIFKKKSAKSKLGFTILATALGAVGAPVLGPKISAHMYKRYNSSEKESLIKTKGYDDKLSKIGAEIRDGSEIRDINTGEPIKPDDPKYVKLMRVGELNIEIYKITDALKCVNKDLEGILSKTPEDIGKSEKEFIKEVNNLSIEGSKILDEMMTILNETNADDISTKTKKFLDKYDTEKYKYNKLQGKISDKFGNGEKSNNKSLDTKGVIMADMSTTYGFIEGIIRGDLKTTITHCHDKELNTLANTYAVKCKKLADWCIKHTHHVNDYTEEEYNKIYSDCKKDYDSIMSKKVLPADGGTDVVNNLKKINMYLDDIHNGAKKLQAIWDKNNK